MLDASVVLIVLPVMLEVLDVGPVVSVVLAVAETVLSALLELSSATPSQSGSSLSDFMPPHGE
ncbi:MAG: hypothetical protein KBB21_34285 [Nannocystaceae bacterium]|nr:hypothetical protein [Deltaproteobacteria bacterium]MBP7291746.1 hypothetical protein [Nannocystaceae bacterium]